MAIHLHITGRVQGVGYRASFELHALRLGLQGWVRNLHDGSVEALVRGSEDALKEIEEWAREGPPAARVTNVTVTEADDADILEDRFSVRPTL